MKEEKIQIIIGAWLIISPWLLGFYDISLAKWNAVLLGILLVLLGAWQLIEGNEKI